jgi:hypothetical protein
VTNGNETSYANMYEIGKRYDFDNDTIKTIVQYLEGEGLVRSQSLGGRLGGIIGITHHGVKEVEEALLKPNSSTKYFPPSSTVHIINVGTMTNSQILQESPNAKQEIIINKDKIKDIEDIFNLIRKSMKDFNLSGSQNKELHSDIQTAESQLSSSNPKFSIINECLRSVSNILEGVATATPIVSRILQLIGGS